VCTQCNEKIEKTPYCLGCYATKSIVPESGCPNSKSIAEIRQALVDDNFDGAKNLDSDEVEDAFEMIEYLRKYREMEKSVPFPLYNTAEMDADVSSKWEELIEIDLKEGGSFIAEPELDMKHIPGVLHLFAALVTFESGKKTEWIKDPAVYESLPYLFINFAIKSRIDSGYWLLMRCVRHAFDSRTPSLDKNTATLILHDGNVGIRIHSSIPASMKKNIYNAGVVATADAILCCKCTCQCGSQNKERILCVHILPLLFLLSLLLFEDLAEHMLLELAACLNADIWDKTSWSDEDVDWMKQSIIVLMEAAGEPIGTHDTSVLRIEQLLEAFVVGTEKKEEMEAEDTNSTKAV